MKAKIWLIASAAVLLSVSAISSYAEDTAQAQTSKQVQKKLDLPLQSTESEFVYGWEIMSAKERKNYQARMKKLKNEKQRTAFLEKHHKQMQKRAKKRGVTLPEAPSQSASESKPSDSTPEMESAPAGGAEPQ